MAAPSCGFKKFFSQGEPVTNVWDKSNHFESETVIEEYLLATAEDPNPDVLRLAISNVAKARAKNSKARAKKQVIMLIWLVALAIAIAFSFRCPGDRERNRRLYRHTSSLILLGIGLGVWLAYSAAEVYPLPNGKQTSGTVIFTSHRKSTYLFSISLNKLSRANCC